MAPGPKLIALVADARARIEEELPAGSRSFPIDPAELLADTPELLEAELLADTPELLDRTEGPLTNPDAELLPVILDVLRKARDYVYDAEEEE